MTKDKALKLALEALEMYELETNSEFQRKAITALKEALAQPEQEPVAIALNTGTKQGVKWLKNVEHGVNLYTTSPAPQRTWAGSGDLEDSNAYQTPPAAQRKPLTYCEECMRPNPADGTACAHGIKENT